MANKELEQLIKNASLAGGDDKEQSLVVTVRMTRDPAYGFPNGADVHPDEVANWQEHGWVIEE